MALGARPTEELLDETVLKVLKSSPSPRGFSELESDVKQVLPTVASKFDVRLATWRLIGEDKVALTFDLKARAK